MSVSNPIVVPMSVPNPIRVSMTVASDMVAIPITVSANLASLPMGLGVAVYETQTEDYLGPYEVTPTQGTQILPITGLKGAQDITVNPIPHNYGLITWNGAILTVS